MFRSNFFPAKRLRPGRWCGAAALVACLGLPGCASLDLDCDGPYPDGPYENETVERSQESGMPGPQRDFFGVSNKARQIEKNCTR